MPNPTSSPRQIFEQARSYAWAELREAPTVANADKVMRRLRVLADQSGEQAFRDAAAGSAPLACKPGCSFCCHEPIPTGQVELAAIAGFVAEAFSQEERSALRQRADAYREARASGSRVAPCPFLAEGLCTIYESRPLACRGVTSVSAEACKSRLEEPAIPRIGSVAHHETCAALSAGAGSYSPGHDRIVPYELGLHVAAMTVGVADRMPLQFVTATRPHPPRRPEEPSGIVSPYPPAWRAFDDKQAAGRLAEAQSLTKSWPSTEQLFFSLRLPLVYSSQQDLEDWRVRYEVRLRELEEAPIDAGAAFQLHCALSTFELAYQGMTVKSLLSRYGNVMAKKVVAPLFPDLTEPIEPRRRSGRIRVGYVSPRLNHWNGSHWALGWLRGHGEEFETFAFNMAPASDEASEQWILGADHYYHLPYATPVIGRYIKSCKLDVLIFTDIGMDGRSLQLSAMRLAPVQCTAWGHPVSSGMPDIDYYLSSDWMEPEGAQDEYTERLVRLPHAGLVFERRPLPPSGEMPPLPDGPFALMCQNLGKCVPKWDFLFAEVAERMGTPIVFLGHVSEGWTSVLQDRLRRGGVRAHWLPNLDPGTYRAVLARAAVSLDPPAWSGGNTTVEAIQSRTPVATFPEPWMRARHSLAFLRRANGAGMVAGSPEEYVESACDLDRMRALAEGIDDAGLFEDREVVEGLNQFLRNVTGP